MKRPICGLIRVLAALMLMHPAFAQERVTHEADALPLIEVPPQGDSGRVAVFYSGDGGWAALDQGVSARLAAAGVEVIGMNSLKYFWRERTPEEAAADLARIVRKALTGRPPSTKVLLIGYSSGADVMPFMVNRLPQELRLRVATVTLIAPGREAQFVFHVADWLPGRSGGGRPLQPEIDRIGLPLLCLYGVEDTSALCPHLPPARALTEQIGSGHHLSADYERVARRILSFADVHAAHSAEPN